MKKQIALLIIAIGISVAYAISAGKHFGAWGVALFIAIWVVVFAWARSRSSKL